MPPVALFVLGLALLAAGGLGLALGSARVGRRCGLGPFAAGLVAAGLATAAAALAFDLAAIGRARMRLAVGNVVGVNVATVTLVLGLAALVRPLAGSSKVAAAGIPVVIAATLLFWFVCRDNALSPVGGGVLLVAFVLALTYLERVAAAEPPTVRAQFDLGTGPAWLGLLLVAGGLAALVGGATLAVPAAGDILRAQRGRGETLGATAAAFGTALPGLVLAVAAARRNRPDAALAVVLGSCLFNVLFVAGVCGLAAPVVAREGNLQVSELAVMNQLPAMALGSLLLLTVLFNRLEVPRGQGVILLLAYGAFVGWQVGK